MNGAHANAPLPSLLAPMRCADPLERPRGWWQAERGSLGGGGERVRPAASEALARARCPRRQRTCMRLVMYIHSDVRCSDLRGGGGFDAPRHLLHSSVFFSGVTRKTLGSALVEQSFLHAVN